MFSCPLCKKPQARCFHEKRLYWKCPRCLGMTLPFAFLDDYPSAQRILKLVQEKVRNPMLGRKLCPMCGARMRKVLSGGGVTEVDSCDRCRVVWFDRGEARISENASPDFSPPPQPQEKQEEETAEAADEVPGPAIELQNPNFENLFGALMSLPLEENVPPPRRTIWATYFLLFTFFVVGLSSFGQPERLIQSYGFVPQYPLSHWGIPILASAFVHAGFWHLVGNCYFFLLVGDNIEDTIGARGLLELFLLSSVGGTIAIMLGTPHSFVPHIGASGGVMGMLVFYALSFPKARLSFFELLVLPSIIPVQVLKIRIPTFVYLLFFLLLTTLLIPMEQAGQSGVSHLSHFGGAVMGFLYWLLFGFRACKRTQGLIRNG